MHGLDLKQTPLRKVYCSQITKDYLRQNPKYHHILPNLVPVPFEVPLEVPYKSSFLTLTLIKSNHCPGSSMVLVQDKTKNVLLTGDMRCEKWWVESLSHNEILYPFTSGFKKLDNIYLDTTYGYRNEPFITFPSNMEGINILNDLISRYPQDDEIKFYFADSTFGFEDVWIKTFNLFGQKFHTQNNIMKRSIPLSNSDFQFNKVAKDLFTTDQHARFHICGKRPHNCSAPVSKFSVRVKALIDVNYEDYISLNMRVPVDDPEAKSLRCAEVLDSGHRIYERTSSTGQVVKYLLPEDSKYFLPSEIYYVFSRHSSYQEVCHFLSKFPKIGDIFPITESSLSWNDGFQIERHFSDYCLKDSEFIYDTIYQKVYNIAPCKADKPKSINKLAKISGTESFNKGSLLLLQSKKFSFCGQDEVRKPFQREEPEAEALDNQKQMEKRTVLYRKGRLLNGRNQHKVRERIEKFGGAALWKDPSSTPVNTSLPESYGYSSDDDVNDEMATLARRMKYNEEQMMKSMAESKSFNDPHAPPLSTMDEPVVSSSPQWRKLDQEEPSRTVIIDLTQSPAKKKTKVTERNIQYYRRCLLESPKKVEECGTLSKKNIDAILMNFRTNLLFDVQLESTIVKKMNNKKPTDNDMT